MKTVNFDVKLNNNASFSGQTYRLTLNGVDGERVELELTENQLELINSRFDRAFFVRCKKEIILQAIDDARNTAALEALAKKYYLCDACAFDDINVYGVKRVLKVVVEALYRYPKLRAKLCFIGTHQRLERLFNKMEKGDEEVLKSFNLQYICTKENAEKLGRIIKNILKSMIDNHEGYVATAMCAYGLFDALMLDKNDYEGYAYVNCLSDLRYSEANGFHPKGCHTTEYVIYHELGHLLDDMCNFYQSAEFARFYGGLTAGEIATGLSQYALHSPKEFIAEAFAECMCNAEPRQIAAKTLALLDTAYRKNR